MEGRVPGEQWLTPCGTTRWRAYAAPRCWAARSATRSRRCCTGPRTPQLGLGWTYDAIEVTESGLADFLGGLGPQWAGLSLTMPLKRAVLPLLATRSSSVVLTCSANTVVLGAAGPAGYNTDVAGIVEAVREHAGDRFATARTATILGGGATARSALVALDALELRDAAVVVRRPEAADDLRLLAEGSGIRLRVVPWSDAAPHLCADVVVSTVPGGVADALVAELPAAVPGTLLDVVYDPWPSRLVAGWQARGGRVVPGHTMLLHQAAHQVQLMTGREAPLAAMRAALAAAVPHPSLIKE